MRQGLLSSVTSWLQSALGRAGVFPNSEFGLHPTASIEQELDERIAWFIAMRWIAVCGVLGTILVGNLIFHLEAPIFPLLGVIVFMVSHNTACHVVIRVNALPESIPFLVEICGSGLVLNLYVARKPQFLLQGLSQCR